MGKIIKEHVRLKAFAHLEKKSLKFLGDNRTSVDAILDVLHKEFPNGKCQWPYSRRNGIN